MQDELKAFREATTRLASRMPTGPAVAFLRWVESAELVAVAALIPESRRAMISVGDESPKEVICE